MKRFQFIFFFILIAQTGVFGQVSEIKEASSTSGKGQSGGGDRSGSGGGLAFDIFFNVLFGEVVQAQRQKLQRRDELPGVISVEAMVQATVQPSAYYLVHPRIRANWGLFSTDFRFNYLLEESIGQTEYLRTDDWQIIQLNLVTTRDVDFRIGGGMMHEAFSGEKVYGEWTMALGVHPSQSTLGGIAEYRNAGVRKEISGSVHYRVFDRGPMHGFLTGGILYQKYYSTISVWGLQGGMVLKIY